MNLQVFLKLRSPVRSLDLPVHRRSSQPNLPPPPPEISQTSLEPRLNVVTKSISLDLQSRLMANPVSLKLRLNASTQSIYKTPWRIQLLPLLPLDFRRPMFASLATSASVGTIRRRNSCRTNRALWLTKAVRSKPRCLPAVLIPICPFLCDIPRLPPVPR